MKIGILENLLVPGLFLILSLHNYTNVCVLMLKTAYLSIPLVIYRKLSSENQSFVKFVYRVGI